MGALGQEFTWYEHSMLKWSDPETPEINHKQELNFSKNVTFTRLHSLHYCKSSTSSEHLRTTHLRVRFKHVEQATIIFGR